MRIEAIPAFQGNYIWLLRQGGDAVVVDPGAAAPVLHRLARDDLRLRGILITHHHDDHVGGVAGLLCHFPVPVFGPAGEDIPLLTRRLTDGERIRVLDGHAGFTVIEVPGHTLGHIAYYDGEHLFCGDTLFPCGCGRVFEGSMAQMPAPCRAWRPSRPPRGCTAPTSTAWPTPASPWPRNPAIRGFRPAAAGWKGAARPGSPPCPPPCGTNWTPTLSCAAASPNCAWPPRPSAASARRTASTCSPPCGNGRTSSRVCSSPRWKTPVGGARRQGRRRRERGPPRLTSGLASRPGDAKFPLIRKRHPGASVRLCAQHGRDLGGASPPVSWPQRTKRNATA